MLLLLAAALNVDALGVGLSYRVRGIKIPFVSKLVICLMSVAATWAAVVLGALLSGVISLTVAKATGAVCLFVTGLWIIHSSLRKQAPTKEIAEKTTLKKIFNIGSITVTIVRDPQRCDFDNSKSLDPFEAFFMGVVLSIDSFCAGIGSGMLNVSAVSLATAAGLFQLIFLYIGEAAGSKLEKKAGGGDKITTVISGLLLIILSIFKLF